MRELLQNESNCLNLQAKATRLPWSCAWCLDNPLVFSELPARCREPAAWHGSHSCTAAHKPVKPLLQAQVSHSSSLGVQVSNNPTCTVMTISQTPSIELLGTGRRREPEALENSHVHVSRVIPVPCVSSGTCSHMRSLRKPSCLNCMRFVSRIKNMWQSCSTALEEHTAF